MPITGRILTTGSSHGQGWSSKTLELLYPSSLCTHNQLEACMLLQAGVGDQIACQPEAHGGTLSSIVRHAMSQQRSGSTACTADINADPQQHGKGFLRNPAQSQAAVSLCHLQNAIRRFAAQVPCPSCCKSLPEQICCLLIDGTLLA